MVYWDARSEEEKKKDLETEILLLIEEAERMIFSPYRYYLAYGDKYIEIHPNYVRKLVYEDLKVKKLPISTGEQWSLDKDGERRYYNESLTQSSRFYWLGVDNYKPSGEQKYKDDMERLIPYFRGIKIFGEDGKFK